MEGVSGCECRINPPGGSRVGAALSKPFTPMEDIRDCLDCIRLIVGSCTLAELGEFDSTLRLAGVTCPIHVPASDESTSGEFMLGTLGSLVLGLTLRLFSRSRKLIGS